MATNTPSASNLNLFVEDVLSNGKAKYLKDLPIGSPKYMESSRMFDNLLKIAGGLCKEVIAEDEFEKLEHHIVEIHPFAVLEISIWHCQITRRPKKKALVQTGWKIILVRDLPCKIFEHIVRILCTANTCFATKTTRTTVEHVVEFTDVRKLMYIFKQAAGIHKDLRKTFAHLGVAKAINCISRKAIQTFIQGEK
ncbi:Hypothetical predicted protein [Paramuricea clavata]|uniref:Uncharacterized protein n=1 Tax=Paramuricea clavata TaxID=317549 RepID=A0A6S7KQR1_PARCT|nr:Hypothetical predicted protein [Paramuricea clavata]